jgi:hypothetical protein
MARRPGLALAFTTVGKDDDCHVVNYVRLSVPRGAFSRCWERHRTALLVVMSGGTLSRNQAQA